MSGISGAKNLSKFSKQAHVGGITMEKVVRSTGSLVLWGGAGAAGVLLFAQGVRKFRNDILEAVPGLAGYFKSTHELPPSDNPF